MYKGDKKGSCGTLPVSASDLLRTLQKGEDETEVPDLLLNTWGQEGEALHGARTRKMIQREEAEEENRLKVEDTVVQPLRDKTREVCNSACRWGFNNGPVH